MGHKPGAHVGGIASLEDLRLRCVITAISDCWHLRTARGKAYDPARRQVIWVHGRGMITATRAAWMLSHSESATIPSRWICYRTCDSYDCVNPDHIKTGPRQKLAALLSEKGVYTTPKRLAQVAEMARKTRRISNAQVLEAMRSGKPQHEAAKELGVCQSSLSARIIRLRGRMAASSVFGSAVLL
jgi:hypothetical protein